MKNVEYQIWIKKELFHYTNNIENHGIMITYLYSVGMPHEIRHI